MTNLCDYTSYADAQRHHSKEALWSLFEGDQDHLNIAYECLDRHEPGDMAVRIARSDGPSQSLTFGELTAMSNRFANYLTARGLIKGDRVAIMLDPSLLFYAAFFGNMKAGCVAVPLFTLFGPDGLKLRIDDCHPELLLLEPRKADLATFGPDTEVCDETFLAKLETCSQDFTANTLASDMAMYQYTSGTTRELPEAVKHNHKSIVTVMMAALYGTGIRPGDRFMCPSSPAWGHGLWHGTVAPLAMGVTIASYAGKFDPAHLLRALNEFKITNLSAAATHYRMMKNSGMTDTIAIKLDKLTFTGEPLDSDTATWAEEYFGRKVGSMYGATEVGVILVDYPAAEDYQIKPGSLGKPVPGVELAILDPDGSACPPNAIGEIAVKRRGAWIGMKDMGHRDEDGYFYHDGRADDVIISAGWTMSAAEIEDTMLKHPDVDEVGVIAVTDETRGQIVKAFVVSKRSASAALTETLQQFTRERLSMHEYPRLVEFVDELPKTPAGKVNRKALREQEKQRLEGVS